MSIDMLAGFCHICLRMDDNQIINICWENDGQLKDILVSIIGDVLRKRLAVYLCQSCCHELARFNKFRKMCLENILGLQQVYISRKAELVHHIDAAKKLRDLVYKKWPGNFTLDGANTILNKESENVNEYQAPVTNYSKENWSLNVENSNAIEDTNEANLPKGAPNIFTENSEIDIVDEVKHIKVERIDDFEEKNCDGTFEFVGCDGYSSYKHANLEPEQDLVPPKEIKAEKEDVETDQNVRMETNESIDALDEPQNDGVWPLRKPRHEMKKMPGKARTTRRFCKICYETNSKYLGRTKAKNCTKKVVTYCGNCTGSPFLCLDCFNTTHRSISA